MLATERSSEEGLMLRQAYCNFLAAAVYLTLARADDEIETSVRPHQLDGW
jgi:hypothetical protein